MSSETMPKKLTQRQRTRKRQPLEVRQGGSPKKVAVEQVSEFLFPPQTALTPVQLPPASLPPPSPVSTRRLPTPLKLPAQVSLHPKLAASLTRTPLLPVGSRRSLSTPSQRFTFRPKLHARTAPTLSHRAFDHELASEQDLPSSQPISLIQLCTRANYARNRTRNARVLHPTSADDMTDMEMSATAHDVDLQSKYPRRLVPSYTVAGFEVGDDNEILTSPPRFTPQEYPWQRDVSHTQSAQEQIYQPPLSDYHAQTNPLNKASLYEPSHARERSYVSESPFLKTSNSSYLDGKTCLGQDTPVIHTNLMTTSEPTAYAQSIHPKEYMPAASLQLYRDSFDRPHDRSPYESIRLKHRNNRTDLPEITSGLQYGGPSDVGYGHSERYTTIRSEPTFATPHRAPLREEIQPSQKSHDACTRRPRLTSGTGLSQRDLKEDIFAILDNMHVGPLAEPRTMSIPHSSDTTDPESDSSDDDELLETGLNAASMLLNEVIRDDTDAERGEPAPQSFDLGQELTINHTQANPAGDALSEPGRSFFEGKKQPEHDHGRCVGDAETLAAKSIGPPPGVGGPGFKPPPGLSGPDFHSALGTSTSLWKADLVQKRLEEAATWFHTDSSREEPLRRLIANIAENHVEGNERLGKQLLSGHERTTVKQTILVIGAALANLNSYNPKERHGPKDYFADYKEVASHYCGSPHEVQRSYFDDVPAIDPWRQHIEETASWCDVD
ncbi:hypothetical protein BJX70DRAFT_169801 [Aspergillus crustosus]